MAITRSSKSLVIRRHSKATNDVVSVSRRSLSEATAPRIFSSARFLRRCVRKRAAVQLPSSHRHCRDTLQIPDTRALEHSLDPRVDVAAIVAKHVDSDFTQDQHPRRESNIRDRKFAGEKTVALHLVIQVIEHPLDRLMEPLDAALIPFAFRLGDLRNQLPDLLSERGIRD